MLTDSQRKTYEFIRNFIQEYGFAPKLPQIAKGIGIKSTGVVHRYIQALLKAGLIEATPHRHRGISLIEQEEATDFGRVCLPLIGKIAAGRPIEALTNYEEFDITQTFTGKNLYVLQVAGESMIEEGILDGDKVICQHCATADDGDIVVALIDNQETTLKRLKRNKNGTITLMPANSALLPMVYDAERVQIQGVFIGLIRVP